MIPGAPKFPRGAKRGSEKYRAWARAYARAKRAHDRGHDKHATTSDVAVAGVKLLVTYATQMASFVDGCYLIPETLWGAFETMKRKSSAAATATELDVLRRCRCG